MADLITQLNAFHFLRPWWLLALAPVWGFALWMAHKEKTAVGPWNNVIAPHILPFLVAANGATGGRRLPLWAAIVWLLLCIAAAGPTWQRIPLPIHKQQQPLVILLDLSPSMLSEDLKPDRLTRARLKISDLLRLRKEGTTALIAYAADAHTVSPLTDDAATIDALLPALNPAVMPAAGSNPEAAVQSGLELIMNAGHLTGDLLLVTDGVADDAQTTINELLDSLPDFRLSVLAVGSDSGSPIPIPGGGFAKDRNGTIIIAGVNHRGLQQFAARNQGRYAALANNDNDILFITAPLSGRNLAAAAQLERTFDSWDDQGFWLILLALPLLLVGFRRNLITLLIVSPYLLASPSAQALDWQDLWLRSDQQAARALAEDNPQRAAELFKDPAWKGTAAYRHEDFAGAAESFAQTKESTGFYNLGNSLAHDNQFEEALAAYETALQLDPDLEDATFNRDVVKKLLEQQQQSQSNSDSEKQQSDNQPSTDNATQDQSSEQQQNSEDKSAQPKNENGSHQQSQPEAGDDTNPDHSPAAHDSASEREDPVAGSENADQKQNNTATPDRPTNTQPRSADQQKPDQASPPERAGALQEDRNAAPVDADKQQALEQWLRQIPDDPSGLMRRKFEYEARRRDYERGNRQLLNESEPERW